MRMALAMLGALTLAACFNPRFKDDLACGPGGECPPGQTCGADLRCHAPSDAATTDGRPDTNLPDGAPDAVPVACTGDGECQTPPNACFKPGTCDQGAHVCVFPAVDCSGSTDSCNDAVCDMTSGECVRVPINENGPCGDRTCGDYGDCTGFVDTCDSSGTQTRDCQQPTCQAGACNTLAVQETQDCARVTDGVTCDVATVTDCGACSGSTNAGCGPGGSQSCTCTDHTCQGDVCTAVATTCAQPCTELAEGDVCGAVICSGGETTRDKCCSATGLCSVFCSPCQ